MIEQLQERLALWSESDTFDEKTREEAERMREALEDVLRAFGGELSFGTGGLRGILGVGTGRMNPYTVARATQGLADDLRARGGKSVAISFDSRRGSRLFADVAAGVLAKSGIKAYVFPDIEPTPILSFAVRFLGADAGIMITASHNPAEYNGYKVYGADGCQLTDGDAARITAAIEKVSYEGLTWLSKEDAEAKGLYERPPEALLKDYLQKTMACRVTGEPIGDLRIVYTPLHGTGLIPVRRVLQAAGAAQVFEVRQQIMPDGNFPTCPKPNPELPETLSLAIEEAKAQRADIVLATDPDSDRVGVAVREADGSYTLPTGNEIGLLLMDYLFSRRQAAGTLPARPVAIKTIVTTDLIFPLARKYGAEVRETLTGFKYIGEQIAELAQAGRVEDFVFGFEESVGYLAGTHVRDKDGVMAVLLIADMAAFHKKEGRTLQDALRLLYEDMEYLMDRLVTIEIEDAAPMQRQVALMAELRQEAPEQIAGAKIVESRDYKGGRNGLPRSNVLALISDRGDKVIVRPSGTEPKIKMYLSAKGADRAAALARLDAVEAEVRGWI